jgi:hypothetical protein
MFQFISYLTRRKSHVKDNILLTNLSDTLTHTRELRLAIFASSRIIHCDIIWETLVDSSDCTALHSKLNAMIYSVVSQQSDLSLSELFCMVDAKLNLVQHVMDQVETSSPWELELTELRVTSCLNEISFLLDVLIKHRKRFFAAKNMQVSALDQ